MLNSLWKEQSQSSPATMPCFFFKQKKKRGKKKRKRKKRNRSVISMGLRAQCTHQPFCSSLSTAKCAQWWFSRSNPTRDRSYPHVQNLLPPQGQCTYRNLLLHCLLLTEQTQPHNTCAAQKIPLNMMDLTAALISTAHQKCWGARTQRWPFS